MNSFLSIMVQNYKKMTTLTRKNEQNMILSQLFSVILQKYSDRTKCFVMSVCQF